MAIQGYVGAPTVEYADLMIKASDMACRIGDPRDRELAAKGIYDLLKNERERCLEHVLSMTEDAHLHDFCARKVQSGAKGR